MAGGGFALFYLVSPQEADTGIACPMILLQSWQCFLALQTPMNKAAIIVSLSSMQREGGRVALAPQAVRTSHSKSNFEACYPGLIANFCHILVSKSLNRSLMPQSHS